MNVVLTWEALRRQVPTGLNFTASGHAYWSSDTGGWQWPNGPKAERPVLLDPAGATAMGPDYKDYPELVPFNDLAGSLVVAPAWPGARGSEVPQVPNRPTMPNSMSSRMVLVMRRRYSSKPCRSTISRRPPISRSVEMRNDRAGMVRD